MSLALPIINLGNLYVNSLQISVASNTTLTMSTGQCRDSSDSVDLTLTSTTTINAATNGANGLDTGSLANATWYAVYIIGSSLNTVATATLLSTSATAPALPSNYDSIRRIGWVLTDSSAHFLVVYITGNANRRDYRWDAVITAKTAAGSSSYAALSLVTSMPSTSKEVYLQYLLVATTAGNSFVLRPTGSASTSNIGASNPVVSPTSILGMINGVTNASQSIDWKTTEAGDALTLWTAGFTDNI